MTRRRVLLYKDFIRQEAALIHADGCTGVTNWNGICCLQHDLEFFHARSSVGAYNRYVAGIPDYWQQSDAVTFEQANAHFKACNFRESRFGYLNPFAWIRYVARRFMRAAWDAHRAREQGV